MNSFPPAGGIGQGGGSLNVPDDHRFATTDARDAAIPSPKEGEQCTIESNIPQYHLLQEYRVDKWVDITYIIQGPKGDQGKEGPQGPAGGKLPHKDLDVGIYGDMNASEWIAEGNFVYAFSEPKLSELSNSPANVYDYGNDPERIFSIVHGEQTVNSHDGKTYVTRTFVINESDRPKAYNREGYIEDGTFNSTPWQPINGMVVSKALPDGSKQLVPSGFMSMGGGLKSLFKGEETQIVSTSPFADIVDIFESVTVSNPEDERTYSYGSSDTADDHEFWLNLDPTDVPEGYSITVNVAPVSQSSLTIYTKKSKEIFAPVIPGSTIVIKRLPGTEVFSMFKSGGAAFAGIADSYADLSLESWKDLPINNYFVAKGTFANIDTDVNGKQGQIYAQVINTDVKDNPNALIYHVYTIQSDDSTINGRQYKRVCRVKSEFATAKIELIGAGGGTGGDGFPDNGSIDNLSSDFKSLSVGKWYVDGWQNTSNLPNDWDDQDRVAVLTVFGGYDGTQNGAFWTLASHRKGIYSAVTSAGVTSDWYKLDGGSIQVDSSNPLEVIAADGSNHDMIAINDDNDVVVGSRSSSLKSLALATHGRHIIAYHSNDDGDEVYDTLAFSSDVNKASGRGIRTIWSRGLAYTITEEDIQNNIVIQCDASVKDGDGNFSLTVTFPTLEIMTKHYWIPKVNDDKQGLLPKITDLEIKCWIDPEAIHEGKHRLYLKSADNAFGWETASNIYDFDGCYMEREHDATTKSTMYEFNFMKIEIGGAETGPMKGYLLQSARADEIFGIDSDSPTNTVDVAHDWNDTQEITAEDIANALGKVQGVDVSSHTDNLGPTSLSATTFKVQRPEVDGKAVSPFAYSFFAFPQDFFTDEDGNLSEPTMVNTGSGNSSDWLVSTVIVDEVSYRVMVSPNRNSAPLLPSARLVQPGVLRK